MNTSLSPLPSAEILIVDDTPNNLRFLSKMLTEQGYEVRKAINGQMALKSVQSEPPDLILLDIMMPDLNGYEVCCELKSDPRTQDIPVIFLSALDEVMDKVKAFKVGGIDYITKPFQFEEVLVRVKTHLTLRQLTQNLEKRVVERTQEMQQALRELQQTQLQLVQHEKMSTLGQLVAGIAHEINNPVNFIAGNLIPAQEYIADLFHLLHLYQTEYPEPTPAICAELKAVDLEFLQQDLPQLIGSMKEGTDRIQHLSRSLRTFSRSDTITQVPFKIEEGLESTLTILQHRLKAQENRPAIEVIKHYQDIPPILCYPGQLNQVFMNLLANAIDALDEASQGRSFAELQAHPNQITLITSLDSQANYVTIRIRDNGPGISDVVKDQLFDYLFTTKPVGKGTGIGLSISRQIIESKHGGQIGCISSLGQGAEFFIKLPALLTEVPELST